LRGSQLAHSHTELREQSARWVPIPAALHMLACVLFDQVATCGAHSRMRLTTDDTSCHLCALVIQDCTVQHTSCMVGLRLLHPVGQIMLDGSDAIDAYDVACDDTYGVRSSVTRSPNYLVRK